MRRKQKPKKIIRKVKPETDLDALTEALTEVLGSDQVHSADTSDQGEPRRFIPSGVPELDDLLDRKGRGWPMGRIIEIYGGEATAKSGIGYALIAQVQKIGGAGVLYPTSEGNVDDWLLERYKVDPSRLKVVPDPTVERVFSSFRKAMRAVGRWGLLVGMIDSVAGLTTIAELEEDDFGQDRAAQRRGMMMSKAFRKIGGEIPHQNAILFCVNQLRDSNDGLSKPKPPGGKALPFYASIRLRLEMVEKVWRQKLGKRFVAGYKIKITCEKNRMAPPWQSITIMLDFDRGLIPIEKRKAKKI